MVSRFDQSSPNVSQPSGQTPYSQHSQMPIMMQSGSDHGPQGSHGPGPQGPPGYMGGSQGRYPAQMPNQPMEQYGQQNYPGNQPGYGPKPMMNQEQYPGYQAPGYGPKQQMAMGYNTPNKNFPSRTDPYMSPGELNPSQIGHFQKQKNFAHIFFTNSYRNTIRVFNSLDPDQTQHKLNIYFSPFRAVNLIIRSELSGLLDFEDRGSHKEF